MAIRQPKLPTAERPPRRPAWQSPYHGVRVTPEEYLALPEEKPYLEYVDGMVLQKPAFAKAEGILCAAVGSHIVDWTRQHGGAAGIMARTAAGDGPSYRIPDVSFWKPGYEGGDEDPPDARDRDPLARPDAGRAAPEMPLLP